MSLPFRLVSADSHMAEPADLRTRRIDRRFLGRAPRILSTNEGSPLENRRKTACGNAIYLYNLPLAP